MRHRTWIALVACCASGLAASVGAQQPMQLAQGAGPRGPAFFSVPAGTHRRVDARNAAVLARRVSLDLFDASAASALTAIERQTGVVFVYAPGTGVPAGRVTMKADDIALLSALTEVLLDAGLDIEVRSGATLVLVPWPERRHESARQPSVGVIAGHVTDAKSGGPLPSVTVTVRGLPALATTGLDGGYALKTVPTGPQHVVFRRLGYASLTLDVAVGGDSTARLDAALEPSAQHLDEVVTTATGEERRVTVGNDIATIQADSVVATSPITSLSDLVEGRAPGVQVLSGSGVAGAGPRIRIRGISSISLSNDPVVIIDGVRMDGTGGQANNFGQQIAGLHDTPSRLDDIDPDEIESLEVLKGPSAATLYGTDAANGVIVIRTKRGHAGPARWSVYGDAGINDVPDHFAENYYAWGHTLDGTHTTVQCPLVALPFSGSPSQADGTCATDSLTHWNPLNHASTSAFGTGRRAAYGAQVSGGGTATQYFGAVEGVNDLGVLQLPQSEIVRLETQRGVSSLPSDQLRPNALDRLNLRTRLTSALASTVDVSLSAAYVSSHQRAPADGSVVLSSINGAGFRDKVDGYDPGNLPGDEFSMEGAELLDRLTGGATGNWRPASWLALHGTVGVDYANTTDQNLTRPGQGLFVANGFGIGRVGDLQLKTTLYTGDFGGTATAPLSSRVTSRTSVGVQYNRRSTTGFGIQASGLAPGTTAPNGAAQQSASQIVVASATLGSYVEQGFSLDERLYFRGAVRVDGASSFGSIYTAAIYPKADISWLVIPRSQALRLRAAFGESGLQPLPTSRLLQYAAAAGVVDGTPTSVVFLSALGNPSVKPERTREIEGGADVTLGHGRVTASLTGYDKESYDALIDLPLAASAFGGSIQENLGSLRNRGIEGSLSVSVIDGRRVSWDVSLNGSLNTSHLLSLGAGVPPISYLESFFSGTRNVPGYPVFGVWARPLAFTDANHDGIIEPNEITVGDSDRFVGPSTPPREITMATGVWFFGRQFRIATQLDARGGNVLEYPPLSVGTQNARAANDRTAPLKDQALQQAILETSALDIAGVPQSADFLRWRELSATWVLTPRLAHRVAHAESVSITLSARNLALLTRYPGPDPETNTAFQVSSSAPPKPADLVFDRGTDPLRRFFTARVNVGF